jgi:hypothetical protein
MTVMTAFGAVYSEDDSAAQTKGAGSALPDISLVVNALAGYAYTPGTFTNFQSNASIDIDEAELNIESSIFPGVKARAVLSYSGDGGFEIEEAYANVLSIWDFFGLKVGRARLGFGKINPVHPHAWAFADTPDALQNFIGELKGDGADLSMIFPLPFFVQLDLTGCHFLGSDNTGCNVYGFGGIGRLWTSTSLGDFGEVELGLSMLSGSGSESTNNVSDSLVLGGADLTLRIWPSPQQRLIWQSELICYNRTVDTNAMYNRLGYYSYLGWSLDKSWTVGARYDCSQTNAMGTSVEDTEFRQSLTGILTCNLNEMTVLRFQYRYCFTDNSQDATLQFIFGMGPHTHPLN